MLKIRFYNISEFLIVFQVITRKKIIFSIQEAYQNKREQYMASLQKKEETIRQTFVQKVKDKENELKKSEQEVCNFLKMIRRHY